MPELKFEAIKSQLNQQEFQPIYFFQGEESFFIDQLTQIIEKNALPEAQKAFNQTIVYGKDIGSDLGKIVDACMRLPMMAERQVVIIKEAQHLSSWDLLLPYLKNPTKSTILVFAHKHKKIDGRSAFAKELKKNAVLYTTKQIRDWEIPKFIEQKVRDQGYSIDPKATQLLVEFLGTDLAKVHNELEKLFLVQKDKTIRPIDIEENIGISKDFNVFELQNAFLAKNRQKVFQILNYFAQNPKAGNIVYVITMLSSTFSKLFTLSQMNSADDNLIAREIGVPPFFVKNYKEAIRKYSIDHIKFNIHQLHLFDLRSKGVQNVNVDANELMKELALKMLDQ